MSSTDADFGLAGAVLTALHAARILIPGPAHALFSSSTTARPQQINDARLTACFVGALLFTALAAGIVGLARRKLKDRALDAFPVALAIGLGASLSWQLAVATLAGVVLLAPLLTATTRDRPPTSAIGTALLLLTCEIVAAGFGVLSANAFQRAAFPIAIAVMVATAVVVAGTVLLSSHRAKALEQRAIAGVPLLACSLLGIAREPSLFFVAAAFALALVLALLRRNFAVDAVSWAAPVALVAIVSTPLALRTLQSANNGRHEGFHAGWIEGVLHGRFFQADVDNIYGLLREWILTAYVAVTGFTLENLRVAFVLVNIAGALLLLRAAKPWLKDRPWLSLAFAYALVFGSVIRCVAFADQGVSVGWADLARCGLAIFGVVGSLRALQDDRPRHVVAFGALVGCAILYSEEFGVTALAATWLAFAFASLSFARRNIAALARLLALHGAGVAAVLVFTAVVYAAFGKAPLLLSTSTILLRVMLNGELVSPPFPFSSQAFAKPFALLTKTSGVSGAFANADVEVLVAPAIYVVAAAVLVSAAVTKEWSPRRTVELGILAFGVVVERVTISRPDVYHMLSTTPPALLLGVSLADNALRSQKHVSRLAVLVATALLAFVAERHAGLQELAKHDVALAKHFATPPSVLPRAGHIVVEKDLVTLIDYIDEHSDPDESIFVRAPDPGMDGPHIYFLADRRMSTRFTMSQELWTDELKNEAYDALVKDPPRLVIGDDKDFIGGKIDAFVKNNYVQVAQIGSWPVFTRAQ